MIDPLKERIFSFAEAPHELAQMGVRGRSGKPLHHSVIFRWAGAGLEYLQVGNVRHTSREALARFFQRNTTPNGGSSSRNDDSRTAEAVAAGARLNATVFRKGPR